jgi:hypothetical protein
MVTACLTGKYKCERGRHQAQALDGRTEIAVIKRSCDPTAAGASDRVSAFWEKTSVKFVMVRGRAPLHYREQEERCKNREGG